MGQLVARYKNIGFVNACCLPEPVEKKFEVIVDGNPLRYTGRRQSWSAEQRESCSTRCRACARGEGAGLMAFCRFLLHVIRKTLRPSCSRFGIAKIDQQARTARFNLAHYCFTVFHHERRTSC